MRIYGFGEVLLAGASVLAFSAAAQAATPARQATSANRGINAYPVRTQIAL
jgi:hypothetical protein